LTLLKKLISATWRWYQNRSQRNVVGRCELDTSGSGSKQ